jgi:hypothetical protein
MRTTRGPPQLPFRDSDASWLLALLTTAASAKSAFSLEVIMFVPNG